MRTLLMRSAAATCILVAPIVVLTQRGQESPVSARAKALHDRAIVVDSHARHDAAADLRQGIRKV